jgi:hypothetical protein
MEHVDQQTRTDCCFKSIKSINQLIQTKERTPYETQETRQKVRINCPNKYKLHQKPESKHGKTRSPYLMNPTSKLSTDQHGITVIIAKHGEAHK